MDLGSCRFFAVGRRRPRASADAAGVDKGTSIGHYRNCNRDDATWMMALRVGALLAMAFAAERMRRQQRVGA